VSDSKRRRVLSFANQNKSQYDKPVPPVGWEHFRLGDFPETPMHFMMGVVKAVMALGYEWAALNNKGTTFVSVVVNRSITLIHTFARISFYPISRYGNEGTYPGWVGGTCQTWWQLMRWVFDMLPEDMDPVPYEMPESHYSRWKGKMCQQFLRSIGTSGVWKMKAEQAKKETKEYFELDEDVRPEATIPIGSNVMLEEMWALIVSTFRMMRLLFLAEHDDESRGAPFCCR
jgi:hypothetical protein